MTDSDGLVLNGLLDSIRGLYSDPHEQRMALERHMQNNPDSRATIARYLLQRGPDCVRVPIIGEVS